MGACTQRPSKEELREHESTDQLTFDKNFQSLPELTATLEILKSSPPRRNQEISRLNQQLKRYVDARRNYTRGAIQIPLLRIEVKKGRNIDTHANCFKPGLPVVALNLFPEGPEVFKTKEGQTVIPEWFEYFEIKQSLETFTHLRLTVKAGTETFGTVDIELASLADQMVKLEWYPLKTTETLNAQLYLKLQLITEEAELYDRLIQECERLIKTLEGLSKS